MHRNCDRTSISNFFVSRTSTAAERFKKWEATLRWKEDIVNKHFITTRFAKNWRKNITPWVSVKSIKKYIFTKCFMLQANIYTDKADYRNINATLLTIICRGGRGRCTPPPEVFYLYSKSSGNPFLKILEFSQLSVADANVKKKKKIPQLRAVLGPSIKIILLL